MENSILHYKDLEAEKLRLINLVEMNKQVLRADMDRLRQQLEPAGKLLQTVGKFSGNGAAKPLVRAGIGLGIDLLLGRTLFKKAGWLGRLALPLVVGAVAGKMGKRKSGGWLPGITRLFQKNGKNT